MQKKEIQLLIIFTLLINFIFIFFPFLTDINPTDFFIISKNMAVQGHWLDLFSAHGTPWLDKPHFPFWMTALSFRLFGAQVWSYILPGFLFYLLGLIYTYKITQLFYRNETISLLAVLICATTFRLMLSTIDLRAEAYLIGQIMPACYYWLKYNEKTNFNYLILGAFFTGCGLMTKGLFILATITSGLIALWIYQKAFKNFISLKWWGALFLSLLFSMPESIALYSQFGISGPEWFFYKSQFGRFFNTSMFHSGSSVYFYFGVFAWGDLPWMIAFVAAVLYSIKQFKKTSIENKNATVFLFSSFFVTFALFSLSHFQGDHYTNIIFPFAAILVAHFFYGLFQKKPTHWIFNVQIVLSVIVLVFGAFIVRMTAIRGYPYFLTVAIAPIALLILMLIVRNRWSRAKKGIIFSVAAANALFLIWFLMLQLVSSQLSAGYLIGKYIHQQPPLPVYEYQHCSNLAVYIHDTCNVKMTSTDLLSIKPPYYLFALTAQLPEIMQALPNAKIVLQRDSIHGMRFYQDIFPEKAFRLTSFSLLYIPIANKDAR